MNEDIKQYETVAVKPHVAKALRKYKKFFTKKTGGRISCSTIIERLLKNDGYDFDKSTKEKKKGGV
jgi:hypothetical protein